MQGVVDRPAGASQLRPPMLEALSRLLTYLGNEGIGCCYWKSTRRLPEVMAGVADLDLLAAKGDQHRMSRVLLGCGFKPFPSVASRDHPSIQSFLAHDEASGRIVHVHLHYALLLGERLLKTHRLPWEKAVLARARFDPRFPIRVLDPASEAVLLALRACLELRRIDPVTLRGWQAARDKFARDRAVLAASVDPAAFRDRAAELLDAPAADLLAEVMFVDRWNAQGGLRRRVRRALSDYRVYNAVEARLRSVARSAHWLAGGLNRRFLHLPRPWSRRAPGGGVLVALLGVDGSGKSTVVAAIGMWLGPEIDVMPIYFGTGEGRPSLLLLPLKTMVPLFTRLVRSKPKGSSHGEVSSRPPGLFYGAALMIWAGVLAVEKRSKLRAARRGAERGMVVVADRFPQDEMPEYNDGPLLPRLAWAPAWLRRFEARSYALAGRLQPDLVIKLEAPAETLAVREPGMDLRVIRERVDAVHRLGFPGARVVRIDATRPLADVLQAVRREVWSML